MYCPQCSQSIVSKAQFCSKCGFPLENIRNLIASGGQVKATDEDKKMPEMPERQKGIRQGIKLLLLCVVLLPMHMVAEGLLPSVENTNMDELPHLIIDTLLWVILLAGLARIFYAFAFNRGAGDKVEGIQTGQLSDTGNRSRLAPSNISATDFGFRQVNTTDMAQAPDVTERTTSLLKD